MEPEGAIRLEFIVVGHSLMTQGLKSCQGHLEPILIPCWNASLRTLKHEHDCADLFTGQSCTTKYVAVTLFYQPKKRTDKIQYNLNVHHHRNSLLKYTTMKYCAVINLQGQSKKLSVLYCEVKQAGCLLILLTFLSPDSCA